MDEVMLLKNWRDPYTESGFFSKITFSWLSDLVSWGFKKRLRLEDLDDVPQNYEIKSNIEELDKNWQKCRLEKGRVLFKAMAITYRK